MFLKNEQEQSKDGMRQGQIKLYYYQSRKCSQKTQKEGCWQLILPQRKWFDIEFQCQIG